MMKFPQYLTFNDYVFTILGYIDDFNEFAEGKGYIEKESGKIAIYKKDVTNDADDNKELEKIARKLEYPVLTKVVRQKGFKTHTILTPTKNSVDEIFNIKQLEDLSTENIINNSHEDDVLYDEAALNDMNSSNGRFVPIINDDDDFLKKIVKSVIIAKGIDIKRLQHKFPEKHGLSNLKSVLVNKTKMSTLNFSIWQELLGFDFNVVITDNGKDNIDPLKKDVIFNSTTGRCEEK